MEQHQFKVSFSVGTKLLISVVALLIIVILFLDVSTILLLKEDKRAYTYQSQSTESVLAGKEFVSMGTHALYSLRLALSSIDPLKPITAQEKTILQSILANQTELATIDVGYLNEKSGEFTPLQPVSTPESLKELELSEAELVPPPELIKVNADALIANSYVFLNLSQVGRSPVAGVVFADMKLRSNPKGLPVAIGFITLKGFGREMKASHLTIANREGWVLFDTDPSALYAKKNLAEDPLFLTAYSTAVANGATEYEFENTRYLGSYTRPGLDLVVTSRIEWRKAMRATFALAEKFVLLACMAIGAAIVFAMLFAKTMTAPINLLYQATKAVAAGNFEVNLIAQAKDEIGALTDSFVAMSRKISELIQESIRKVHLENELAIVSTVQQTLIPPSVFKNDQILIQSLYQAADQCGGDWWGFFGVGNKMCLMIADATGHGLPSALITASARSCFSVMHKLAQEDPEFTYSPAAMLSYANRVVHDAASGKIMMTFFSGVIDFEAKTLTYANAGHNPPWLFKKQDGKYVLKSLASSGLRLGEARDVPAFDEKVVDIALDDILFLYTDGLMEGKNLAGDMLGKKRVRKVVEANLDVGPEKVVQALIEDFQEHNKGKHLDDDITLAVSKILGFHNGA